jgi:hypothetical protein
VLYGLVRKALFYHVVGLFSIPPAITNHANTHRKYDSRKDSGQDIRPDSRQNSRQDEDSSRRYIKNREVDGFVPNFFQYL